MATVDYDKHSVDHVQHTPNLSNKLTLPTTHNPLEEDSLFVTVNDATTPGCTSALDVDLMNTPEVDGVPVSYA